MRFILTTLLTITTLTVFGQKVKTDSCYSILDTLTGQQVFKFQDRIPKVEGGMEQLMKELSKRIKYPHIDRSHVDTKVVVAFIIDEDGQLTGKRVVKDFQGYGLKLLEILNDFVWEPGFCEGHRVPTLQLFPVIFHL
jgi:hypothetical protein